MHGYITSHGDDLTENEHFVSRLSTDLEIAPRSGAASCPYNWSALNVAGKPPPVDSSWHAVARSLEPPSGALVPKMYTENGDWLVFQSAARLTHDAASSTARCLRA